MFFMTSSERSLHLMLMLEREKRYMQKSETIEYSVFHPKQEGPTATSNRELEEYVRNIVSHSSETDLQRRFFSMPNLETIPGSITGSIPDKDVQPRDIVIVAFANQEPVGYTDIARIAGQADRAEMAMLVRSDLQRKGIGKTMMQAMIPLLRNEGVKHVVARVHPENTKMNQALYKWSQTEGLQDITFRSAVQEDEIVHYIDLEPDESS
jgi:RimJ/RimL family protein N-acetyltransferase